LLRALAQLFRRTPQEVRTVPPAAVIWVAVDVNLPQHRKVMAAGPRGPLLLALQVTAVCYSRLALSDGAIPAALVDDLTRHLRGMEPLPSHLAPRPDWPTEMVEAGLWDETEAGYAVHDYADYNQTRDEAERSHERAVEAGRYGGVQSGKSRRNKDKSAEATPSSKPSKPPLEAGPSRAPRAPRSEAHPSSTPLKGSAKQSRVHRAEQKIGSATPSVGAVTERRSEGGALSSTDPRSQDPESEPPRSPKAPPPTTRGVSAAHNTRAAQSEPSEPDYPEPTRTEAKAMIRSFVEAARSTVKTLPRSVQPVVGPEVRQALLARLSAAAVVAVAAGVPTARDPDEEVQLYAESPAHEVEQRVLTLEQLARAALQSRGATASTRTASPPEPSPKAVEIVEPGRNGDEAPESDLEPRPPFEVEPPAPPPVSGRVGEPVELRALLRRAKAGARGRR